MSSMLSAPATIPATSAFTFAPALEPLSVGTVEVLVSQRLQTAFLGQRHDRDQASTRHQVRVIEERRRDGPSVR